MTTLSLDSRPLHSGSFHFDLPGAVAAGAFAVAMIVCFRHGDASAIPALIALAAMTLIVFSVHAPTAPRGPAQDLDAERTHLRRRECLKQ